LNPSKCPGRKPILAMVEPEVAVGISAAALHEVPSAGHLRIPLTTVLPRSRRSVQEKLAQCWEHPLSRQEKMARMALLYEEELSTVRAQMGKARGEVFRLAARCGELVQDPDEPPEVAEGAEDEEDEGADEESDDQEPEQEQEGELEQEEAYEEEQEEVGEQEEEKMGEEEEEEREEEQEEQLEQKEVHEQEDLYEQEQQEQQEQQGEQEEEEQEEQEEKGQEEHEEQESLPVEPSSAVISAEEVPGASPTSSQSASEEELERCLEDARRWTIFEDAEEEAAHHRHRGDVLARGIIALRGKIVRLQEAEAELLDEVSRLHEAGAEMQELYEKALEEVSQAAGDVAYWRDLAEGALTVVATESSGATSPGSPQDGSLSLQSQEPSLQLESKPALEVTAEVEKAWETADVNLGEATRWAIEQAAGCPEEEQLETPEKRYDEAADLRAEAERLRAEAAELRTDLGEARRELEQDWDAKVALRRELDKVRRALEQETTRRELAEELASASENLASPRLCGGLSASRGLLRACLRIVDNEVEGAAEDASLEAPTPSSSRHAQAVVSPPFPSRRGAKQASTEGVAHAGCEARRTSGGTYVRWTGCSWRCIVGRGLMLLASMLIRHAAPVAWELLFPSGPEEPLRLNISRVPSPGLAIRTLGCGEILPCAINGSADGPGVVTDAGARGVLGVSDILAVQQLAESPAESQMYGLVEPLLQVGSGDQAPANATDDADVTATLRVAFDDGHAPAPRANLKVFGIAVGSAVTAALGIAIQSLVGM